MYQTMANKDWRKLTKLILKEDKEVFRNSLISINKGLYLELENMYHKYVKKERKPSPKKSSRNAATSEAQVDVPEEPKEILCPEIPDSTFKPKVVKIELDSEESHHIVKKRHSELDELLMAFRMKQINEQTLKDQKRSSSPFELYLRKHLQQIQNRQNTAAYKRRCMTRNSNRSMEVPSMHPFLQSAKEYKISSIAPVKIKSKGLKKPNSDLVTKAPQLVLNTSFGPKIQSDNSTATTDARITQPGNLRFIYPKNPGKTGFRMFSNERQKLATSPEKVLNFR